MILLFGGKGFIGQHVSALMCALGHEVTVVSRQVDAASGGGFPGPQYLTSEELRGEVGRLVLKRATSIVYLASTSVPSTFASTPWQEIPSNVETATRFFFECSQVNPSAKIVLISSGGTIYGHVGREPINEDRKPAPISGYGLGKLMIEEALRFSARTSGLRFNILRVSNPIGKFQVNQSQGIVPIAMRAIRDGKPFGIFGDGSHIRDYIDADDVAQAICAACMDSVHNEHTWNVGSGRGRSILDIIALVERVTNKKLSVQYHPSRSLDVPCIVLDSSRIRAALGWNPTRSVEDSCSDVWRWLTAGHQREKAIYLP